MGYSLPRGSSCRLCFYPQGGINVADLGDPVVAIKQELTFISKDAVVDVENNRVYVDLTEEDTIQLVENVETKVQVVYLNDDSETVYRFPIHNLIITDTLFERFYVPPTYTYDPVDPTEEGYSETNPSQEGWYELDGNDYKLTEDTEVVEFKQYFTRSLAEE